MASGESPKTTQKDVGVREAISSNENEDVHVEIQSAAAFMNDAPSLTATVFAYGSNMLTTRMKERASSARLIAPALLERFALRWHKRSDDGSGKCSIEETGRREDFVWGVLYELNAMDKTKLDKIEGLGKGYGERRVMVLSDGKTLSAVAYYATSVDPHVRPYDWYRELVIAGAREQGLPPEYIQGLETTIFVQDLNKVRAAREREAIRLLKDPAK